MTEYFNIISFLTSHFLSWPEFKVNKSNTNVCGTICRVFCELLLALASCKEQQFSHLTDPLLQVLKQCGAERVDCCSKSEIAKHRTQETVPFMGTTPSLLVDILMLACWKKWTGWPYYEQWKPKRAGSCEKKSRLSKKQILLNGKFALIYCPIMLCVFIEQHRVLCASAHAIASLCYNPELLLFWDLKLTASAVCHAFLLLQL